MAAVRSLGVHTPAALEYLIAEGILPAQPGPRSYTWESYIINAQGGHKQEELVCTDYCVVWSRGALVRKVFRFDVEGEKVQQALLTHFPTEQSSFERRTEHARDNDGTGSIGRPRAARFSEFGRRSEANLSVIAGSDGEVAQLEPRTNSAVEPRFERALVVFLESQAHLYLLSGSSHIIKLPFEVERAFAAPRGLFIQRKVKSGDAVPPTPSLPAVPANSFTTAHNSSQSFRQSRLNPSFKSPQSFKQKQPATAQAAFLQNLLKEATLGLEDDLPPLYSLTDPLSELGLVLDTDSTHQPGHLDIASASAKQLLPLAASEELLYVSQNDELQISATVGTPPLILAVTLNRLRQAYAIWYVRYIEPRSATSVRRKRSPAASGYHSRRRSSFVTATGATTPSARPRDSVREPSRGLARGQTGPSPGAAVQVNEQLSKQEAEEALARQLDPDYGMTVRPNKGSRRVSSLMSRTDLSTSFDKSAFQELATNRGSFGASGGSQSRRHVSLGSYNARTSFGTSSRLQRHRASTPGSLSRLSLGNESADDTIEDIDTMSLDEQTFLADRNESLIEELSWHISGHGLQKEAVMTKFAEVPMTGPNGRPSADSSTQSERRHPRVFVCRATSSHPKLDVGRHLQMHIISTDPLEHCLLDITVNEHQPYTSSTIPRVTAGRATATVSWIPSLGEVKRFQNHLDAVKLVDHDVERVLFLQQEPSGTQTMSISSSSFGSDSFSISLGSLRLFNPHSLGEETSPLRVSAGLKRTLGAPEHLRNLDHPGPDGGVDLRVADGTLNRLQVQLRPRDALVMRAVAICEHVLPGHNSEALLPLWWDILKNHRHELGINNKSTEWAAFVVLVFTFAANHVDEATIRLTASSQTTRAPANRKRSSRSRTLSSASTDAASTYASMMDLERASKGTRSGSSSPWNWAIGSLNLLAASPGETSRLHAIVSDSAPSTLIPQLANVARKYLRSKKNREPAYWLCRLTIQDSREVLSRILVGLHLLLEEQKLDSFANGNSNVKTGDLAAVLAQLGHWLGWDTWSWQRNGYYDLEGASVDFWTFEDSRVGGRITPLPHSLEHPPSVLQYISANYVSGAVTSFPTLDSYFDRVTSVPVEQNGLRGASALTPRTYAITNLLPQLSQYSNRASALVEAMARLGVDNAMLETFPEGVLAVLREAIVWCQSSPPTTWPSQLLSLVGRLDLKPLSTCQLEMASDTRPVHATTHPPHDLRNLCHSVEQPSLTPTNSSVEADRLMISRLMFSEDHRLLEASRLVNPLRAPVVQSITAPGLTDAQTLEAQREIVHWVTMRTLALPCGQAMISYQSRRPLITEKYPINGFRTECILKPMNITVSADRSTFTEEKFSWAYFHAGVSSGLWISRNAESIDTSWIVFNKPQELTNRHAGLLFALGLNGHLKSIAKWLLFKYLTPKHTMTSIALLLGLSVSYIGSMDTQITRMLSVHVTRMLPPGAADINVSPLAQTTGLMGIGLLYHNTQHRRMSEIMLSEIERCEPEDPSTGAPDALRNEGYRLAAGFALGLINLAKGGDLRGLHDMRLVERLLAVAVGHKQVDMVHVLDQATAGATIALALIFMKTGNAIVARKIDVPDTIPQFDYVRPDLFLLRTLATRLIMWDKIRPNHKWIARHLPSTYRPISQMTNVKALQSNHLPFYNIVAGLLWSIGLRYAGTGDTTVKEFLLSYLDQFIRLCSLQAYRYDDRLTQATVRNCQNVVALSAATVMAGKGDLDVFRRLRLLHGRTDRETPYGSHLASHLAIGALFLGAGTFTFSSSNLAVAALVCAFYPLFPADVHDNKAHLQAFRHFWVLAAEPRCIIIRDVDTRRPISQPVSVTFRDGTERSYWAPCLLPELSTIALVKTDSPEYWQVVLDFVANPSHLSSFRQNQTMYVRRRPVKDAHGSTFSATLVALNGALQYKAYWAAWDWMFALPVFRDLEKADQYLVIPQDLNSSVHLDDGDTPIDHRLALAKNVASADRDDLLDLRGVFEWARQAQSEGDGRLGWLGWEAIEGLRAKIMERGSRVAEASQ